MSADSGRARSRFRGVLSLYGSPGGEHPILEIRVKRMCRTPPYNRRQTRERLTTEPFPSWLCLADLQYVNGLGELSGAPGAAAELAEDVPGFELGVRALAG
jgi:hypothetical protein